MSAQTEERLSLLEFAEVFLRLPENAKREVLGYAKCLYASANGDSFRDSTQRKERPGA